MSEMQKIQINEVEAAARYGLSVHWFRRARWEGTGPAFVKMAGRCLYPIAGTDKFFEDRLVSSTSVKCSHQVGGPGRGRKKSAATAA